MNTAALKLVLQDAMLTLEASRDELRDLDAAIGDGDLGITVSEGARAVGEGVAGLPDDAPIADVLRTSARRFASANPSTMAALVGAGLAAAAKAVGGANDLDRAGCAVVLDAAMTAIQQRGGAELGDKTMLDAIAPTLADLRTHDGDEGTVLKQMIASAQAAVAATTPAQSQRGRAAWVGERSIGHPDGGAVAYVRLLQAIDRALHHADV